MSIYNQVNKPVLRRPVEPGLRAMVGMDHGPAAGIPLLDRHPERVQDELGLEVVAHRPADDPAAEDVLDGGEEEKALPGLDVLEVADPEPVRLRPGEVTVDEVGRRAPLGVPDSRPRAAAFAVGTTKAELAHQPSDP